ncbi:MAG: hypothetical protein O2904_01690 [bacterium]|nr:hypothetical protein [bacterium]
MINRLESSDNLNAKTHTGQVLKDTGRFHFRADGIRQTIGAPIMSIAHPVGKIGNGVVKDLGNLFLDEGDKIAPEPLGNGSLKHLRRDIPSIARNTGNAVVNLITLHPLRATGNLINAGADAFDIAIVDPLLDGGNLIFGHEDEKRNGVFAEHELN